MILSDKKTRFSKSRLSNGVPSPLGGYLRTGCNRTFARQTTSVCATIIVFFSCFWPGKAASEELNRKQIESLLAQTMQLRSPQKLHKAADALNELRRQGIRLSDKTLAWVAASRSKGRRAEAEWDSRRPAGPGIASDWSGEQRVEDAVDAMRRMDNTQRVFAYVKASKDKTTYVFRRRWHFREVDANHIRRPTLSADIVRWINPEPNRWGIVARNAPELDGRDSFWEFENANSEMLETAKRIKKMTDGNHRLSKSILRRLAREARSLRYDDGGTFGQRSKTTKKQSENPGYVKLMRELDRALALQSPTVVARVKSRRSRTPHLRYIPTPSRGSRK